jgi:hypothetical protein
MQAVLCNSVAVGTKPLIAPGRPVTADYVDFGVGTTQSGRQIVEQIEDARIVLMNIASAVIAKKVVELRKSRRIVAVAVAIDDVQVLAGVGVEEMKAVGISRRIGFGSESSTGNKGEEKAGDEKEC